MVKGQRPQDKEKRKRFRKEVTAFSTCSSNRHALSPGNETTGKTFTYENSQLKRTKEQFHILHILPPNHRLNLVRNIKQTEEMTCFVRILNYLLGLYIFVFGCVFFFVVVTHLHYLRVILMMICVDTEPNTWLCEEVQGSIALLIKQAPTFKKSGIHT